MDYISLTHITGWNKAWKKYMAQPFCQYQSSDSWPTGMQLLDCPSGVMRRHRQTIKNRNVQIPRYLRQSAHTHTAKIYVHTTHLWHLLLDLYFMFVFVLTYMHIVVYSMRAVGADVFISRFAVLPTAQLWLPIVSRIGLIFLNKSH